ncbi:HesA/MoeB/ThiF family protein [Helicobacter cetorum]|uniref:Molybdopterin-synthase adenylyltransferase n=1 Tax=Helicobacter cetorum (strain ATCC BAA-540 / CCUG 52418 / MIT 99-5656) TaxID=1163745 RepID=I0ET96_HELCM|nr:HesA/MoeB/ThiF family protein [Helicobacter cetorum]AFI06165.1 thiamin biosynthesis protein (thiF) [Helicobacter cetorum MIT 99-5656]
MLSQPQKERYLRHIMLEDVGEEGQLKLLESSVLVIGAGGLGSVVLMYLCATGIGRIGIVDFDKVDLSNLQRQIIHSQDFLNQSKVSSAKARLNTLNADVKTETFEERFNASNALSLIEPYDFIIDATDNFNAKFLINDACVLAHKPYSHAGVLKYRGQSMSVLPSSACLACVFDRPPKKELNPIFKAGLFGVLPGVLGCIQASEAIKYFLGIKTLLTNTLLTADIKTMDFKKVQVMKNPECRVCGTHKITHLQDYEI